MIQVGLLSAGNTGEAEWTKIPIKYTDANGRFAFRQLEPSTYIVSVQYFQAPDVELSYGRVFYPGVAAESDAARIEASPNMPVTLKSLRLRRLPCC